MARLPRPSAEVIAHRGASAYVREHTIGAYDRALELGADALELDVRATSDDELVVVHDATLLRTALDPRAVAGLSRADLTALDPDLRPLTLDAVLARYGRRTRLLIELKDPSPLWEHGVVEAIARHGLIDHATVQSFDQAALHRLHLAAPWLAVAPLLRAAPATSRAMAAIAGYATGIGVRRDAVNRTLVLRAHFAGLAVRTWTVNCPGEIGRLLALGVDGVITDMPDVAREAIDQPRVVAALAA